MDGYTGRAAVAAGEAFDPTPANIQARTDSFVLGDGLRVSLLPKKTRGEMATATLVFRFGDEAAITGRTDAAAGAPNKDAWADAVETAASGSQLSSTAHQRAAANRSSAVPPSSNST